MKNSWIAAFLGLLLVGQASGKKNIPDHAIADLVLGQPDFSIGAFVFPVSSFNSSGPDAVTVDPVSRKVFVAEYGNNRILRYPNANSLANGAGAEAVFGQADFNTGSGGSGALQLDDPLGLFFDRFGRLWVADTSNHRVLMYEAASYRSTQPQPDRVYGQPDFTTTIPDTTATTMRFPQGVFVDANDRLWVADTNNSRVLRFDNISTKPNGSAADGVLGQALFTTGGSAAGAAGLNAPTSIAVSQSGALFVVSRNDNRVLRFNQAASLADGASASAVFGQPNFISDSDGLSATRMNEPVGAWLTPEDSLWVCDSDNSRVLRFDHASTKSKGAAADGVVGQPNFTTNATNVTRRGLSLPGNHPFVDATGNLWVPDRNNNRVLRFPPDFTKPVLTVSSAVPKKVSQKNLWIKGTASDTYGISKVTYKVNAGSTKTATGTTGWRFKAALKMGKNTITINSVDSVGNKSTSKVLKIVRK